MQNKKLLIFTHVFCVIAFLSTPLLFIDSYESLSLLKLVAIYTVPIMLVIVFYFNYDFLLPHIFFTKKRWLYYPAAVMLAISVSILTFFFLDFVHPENSVEELKMLETKKKILFKWPKGYEITRDFFSFLTSIGLGLSIKTLFRSKKIEDHQKELERTNYEATIASLRHQLSPHFLFNTLNNILSLASISPEKTQKAIYDLSKMLRYVLFEDKEELVPFRKEIDFIQNYVSLVKLRLGTNVKTEIKINLPKETLDEPVIPLLSISLIENAFKYGVSLSNESKIAIHIYMFDDTHVITLVSNTYFPQNNAKEKTGIGLKNLEQRLKLQFPNDHTFKTEIVNGEYIATIIIPLKKNLYETNM